MIFDYLFSQIELKNNTGFQYPINLRLMMYILLGLYNSGFVQHASLNYIC